MKKTLLLLFTLLFAVSAWAQTPPPNELLNETFDDPVPLVDQSLLLGLFPGSHDNEWNGQWYRDRYAPGVFESYNFNGENVLRIATGFAESAAERLSNGYSTTPGKCHAMSGQPTGSHDCGHNHYNTQGYLFNQDGLGAITFSGDLYIPADWETKHRRSDIWATLTNSSGDVTAYPIWAFSNSTGSSPVFRYWGPGVSGWQNPGVDIVYDAWTNFEVRLINETLQYYLNGELVGTLSAPGSVEIRDVKIKIFNFDDPNLESFAEGMYDPGNSYEAYWDNIITTQGPVYNVTQEFYHATIQAAIDAAYPGDEINIAAGYYEENMATWKDLEITKSLTLKGAGSGQTIIGLREFVSPNTALNGVEINGANLDIHLEGLTFTKRTGATNGPQRALRIGETSSTFNSLTMIDVEVTHAALHNVALDGNVTITLFNMTDCKFTDAGLNGVYSFATIQGGAWINNVFDLNGRNDEYGGGLHLAGPTSDLTITGGSMSNNAHVGFAGRRLTNVEFEDVVANSNGPGNPGLMGYQGYGMVINEKHSISENVAFTNVNMIDNKLDGMMLTAENGKEIKNITITGGTYTGHDRHAIWNWPQAGGIISDVTIDGITTSGKGPFKFHHISDINILNSTIGGGSGFGIDVKYAYDVTISGNNVTGRQAHAVIVWNTTDFEISGNDINDNDVVGIFLQDVSNGLVSANNLIKNNQDESHGGYNNNPGNLVFRENCENITVTGNTIRESKRHGIWINEGSNSNITVNNNNLTDNELFQINNEDLFTVNATCNWWDTTDGAEIEDLIEGDVIFTPWLLDDDLENPVCDGYPAGTVFVIDENGDIDDFFMGATPISDAMGIANDGDLVNISSGEYDDVIDASGSPDPALNIAIGESPGCVTVTGLILTDNDTYEQDIWDYDPCTGYDQLTVDGDVSLGDAVLEIDLDGFMPAPGFAFEIITYTGARTGEFAQNTLTINGRDYEVNYDDDNKVITVTGAGYANYTWTQSDVEVEACQETTVNVNIETLGDITNAELKLSYDATRLEVMSVTYMGSGATVASDISVSGEIFFAAEWALSGGFAGPSEGFLEIVFKGIRDEVANAGTEDGIVQAIEFGEFNGTRILNNYGFIGDAIEPVWADVLLDAETLDLDVTPDETDPEINGDGVCLSLDDSRFVNSGNGYLVSGDEFDVITGATDDCATPTITHNASSITGADGSAATSAASLDGWNLPVGTHTITFTASDGFNSVTCPVVITVVPQTLTGNAIINMACNDGADVRIRLYDGSTQVGGDFATTLDASGNFETPVELTGVPAGTYTVYAKIERYLSKVFTGVDMTSSSAQPNIGLTQVIPGDIAGPSDDFNDDAINATDLSLLVNNYNTALDTNSPAPAVRCDLNCDNFVDAIDLSFISFFYGEFVSAP